ncbi:DsbA family protein [Paenisporosarcina cavernae]|uniref:ClpXP adapter protein SpxH n=1 Tax=Paenisporosarcina cavernae TaxID=2320858 RepID=A0A385YRJ7_9BACL|nr:DsbA family protein [Paenisporosarcina cavernae]AYC29020.1 DsbA family protein [Paenisporosarcina cavernae]
MSNVEIPPEEFVQSTTKPVELYAFIDPLCADCFDLQPTLRKLQVKYDQYFTLRIVVSTRLSALNTKVTKGKTDDEDNYAHPALPAVAIKAAELQGKRAGMRFLQKVQEQIFLNTKSCTNFNALKEIAETVELDLQEFESDFKSNEASRAFQCDLYITREMEVTEVPTLVFFNENIEDEGLKVSGTYDFDVYKHILQEMVNEELVEKEPPTLDELFDRYETLSTHEVAAIYGVTPYMAERELKKRTLLQQLERIPQPETTHWRIKKYA